MPKPSSPYSLRKAALAGQRLTFRAYVEGLWLPDKAEDVRENTWNGYDHNMRRYILPRLGDSLLEDVGPYAVRQLLKGLPTPHVRASVFRVLRVCLNDAARDSFIERSPMGNVEAPAVPQRELVTLTPEEANAYLDLFAGHRYELAVALALMCGLRRSEIAALDKQSLRGGVIPIKRGLHHTKGGGMHFEPPKSRRSKRDVMPPDFIVEMCPKGFGPLFPHDGGYTDPAVISRAYNRHLHETVDGEFQFRFPALGGALRRSEERRDLLPPSQRVIGHSTYRLRSRLTLSTCRNSDKPR
jgi:integrase